MEILNYETPEDKTYSKDEIEIFTIAKDIQTKSKINIKSWIKTPIKQKN